MNYDVGAAAQTLAAELGDIGINVDAISVALRAAHTAGRLDGVKLDQLTPVLDKRLPPSPRQAAILDFLVKRISVTHIAPSIREIGHEFGINSTTGVLDHLKALERKGYILRDSLKSRSIMLNNWPVRSILGEMRALGVPEFPVDWTLRVCAQAADHLEHVLDWDGHGWEVVRHAVRVAAAYLDNRMPSAVDHGCGPATPSVEALRSRPAFGPRHGE